MLGNGAVQHSNQQLDPKFVRDEHLIADLINGGIVPYFCSYSSLLEFSDMGGYWSFHQPKLPHGIFIIALVDDALHIRRMWIYFCVLYRIIVALLV
jgi:hypothetical protein